ncbi:hypothetical protein BDR04DRAFT_472551 [Suillus decipiens]|nr:hypothetical protein BDR04DRAFT_472551 [Suillus decipiens]
MACGLDFGHFGAYDLWVLLDRQAKLASGIRLSCDANRLSRIRIFLLKRYHTLTHPAARDPFMRGLGPFLTPPIQCRAFSPGECFSSESFLLPYDLRRQFNLQRIYINPMVISAYKWRYYPYFKWFMRHPVLRGGSKSV